MRWTSTRAWDLAACVAVLVLVDALALLDLGGALRIALGLAAVLFVPGYAFVAALFPERHKETDVEVGEAGRAKTRRSERGIGALERVALAFGLSIAIVPLLGLALNFTPWGIRLLPILVTLTLFTALSAGIAAWRRARLPAAERFELVVDVEPPAWRGASPLDRALTVALVVAVLVAAGALVYVLATPRQGERFTEFYVLGPDGKAEGYPTNLSANQTGRVILGIVNHEGTNVTYAVRMVAVSGHYENQTGNLTFVGDANRTLQSWSQPLGEGATWEQNVTFALPSGDYRVVFELDKPDAETTPYRELHLYVHVG